jgi:hypothetical protein
VNNNKPRERERREDQSFPDADISFQAMVSFIVDIKRKKKKKAHLIHPSTRQPRHYSTDP